MRLSAFLEDLASLKDSGTREGEAAAETQGAVRIMTIHKAKGLEYPVVVLGDAARQVRDRRTPACRLGESWTFAPDRLPKNLEGTPLAHRWQLPGCRPGGLRGTAPAVRGTDACPRKNCW